MNDKQKIEYLQTCLKNSLETYETILNNRPDFPHRVRWLFDSRNEIANFAATLHDAEIITDKEFFEVNHRIERYN